MSGNRSPPSKVLRRFFFGGWMVGKAVELALVTRTFALLAKIHLIQGFTHAFLPFRESIGGTMARFG